MSGKDLFTLLDKNSRNRTADARLFGLVPSVATDSNVKELSTQFVRAVFSAGRSIFAFEREPVFSQFDGEFRKVGWEVKFYDALVDPTAGL